jgi:hypothetical protein
VLRDRGTRTHAVVAVLEDGTLGMATRETFFWASPQGAEPVEHEMGQGERLTYQGRPQRVLRGGPRGLFLLDQADADYTAHVAFVPLDGRTLSWERRVQVTQQPVSTQVPPYPQVDGPRVAVGRSVLDLDTGRRHELPLHEMHSVRALGSGYAAGFSELVRLEDGRRIALPDASASYVQVFAIRNGLAHALRVRGWTGTYGQERGDDTLEVWALDPAGARPEQKLAEAKARDLPSSFAHLGRGQQIAIGSLHVAWDREGFWLFDGTAWHRHPWHAP